jgi:phosphosulfolactate synthase (CoM biosynthesis protein A)
MDGAIGMEVETKMSYILNLIKKAFKYSFAFLEESGRKMNEAEERLMFGDKDERKEK